MIMHGPTNFSYSSLRSHGYKVSMTFNNNPMYGRQNALTLPVTAVVSMPQITLNVMVIQCIIAQLLLPLTIY